MIFKYLILSMLSLSSLPEEGDDGWFSVSKQPKVEDLTEEDDPSIWVLFSKNLEGERILVRFPEVPSYQYSEAGELFILSQRDGEIFQLIIRPSHLESIVPQKFPEETEGKWIREHLIRSPRHFFHFKTISLTPNSENHRAFISSFSIEKTG